MTGSSAAAGRPGGGGGQREEQGAETDGQIQQLPIAAGWTHILVCDPLFIHYINYHFTRQSAPPEEGDRLPLFSVIPTHLLIHVSIEPLRWLALFMRNFADLR